MGAQLQSAVSPQVAAEPALSIRAGLALVAAACAVPAVLIGALLIAYDYGHERARLIRDSLSTARALVAAVDTDLTGAKSALFALGSSPYLVSGDFSAFHAQATAALANQSFINIVLTDETGAQLLNTLRPYGEPLPAGGATPAEEIKRVFAAGEPVVTDLFIGPLAHTALVGVGVPVRIDEKIRYSLSAGITSEHLSRILTQQRLPPGWLGAIFDSTGTIVARTSEAERFVGQKGIPRLIQRMGEVSEGALKSRTLEGIPGLIVYSRSPVSNWTVAIGIPTAQLMADLWRVIGWLTLASAALVGAGILVALYVGGRIIRSVQGLAAPALALSGGAPVEVPLLALKEAHQVGGALERAWGLFKEVQQRASTDLLTGLKNRPGFADVLRRELGVAIKTGGKLALLYVDLDGFKAVNDQHGHQVGDELLSAVARRLEASVRHISDATGRIGGDEFAVVLSDAGAQEAGLVAGKIVASLEMPYRISDALLKVSASLGIATYPESASTAEALLQAADEAMYAAKKAGGGRFAVAPPA